MLPHITDFLESLHSLSYSAETIYNYERDLKVFEQFLVDSSIGFANVDKQTVGYYKAYLSSQDRRTAS